ncbi:hypothetical protein DWZ25_01810 [Faecalibacterium prausnitzii]|uniref:Uncharacterized protein n=1 Tax=Faecalibacterium prausnitzii TaxID=853 RepID=A0A3E2U314_9FIRM|nr:hypothetical protein DWZ25_01810 [Faecalibacterium prausnitzii]
MKDSDYQLEIFLQPLLCFAFLQLINSRHIFQILQLLDLIFFDMESIHCRDIFHWAPVLQLMELIQRLNITQNFMWNMVLCMCMD